MSLQASGYTQAVLDHWKKIMEQAGLWNADRQEEYDKASSRVEDLSDNEWSANGPY